MDNQQAQAEAKLVFVKEINLAQSFLNRIREDAYSNTSFQKSSEEIICKFPTFENNMLATDKDNNVIS